MTAQETIQKIADELKAIVAIKEQNEDYTSELEIRYILTLMTNVRHKAGQTLTDYGH